MRRLTEDDLRAQFNRKDPRLLDIVIEAANWIEPYGFFPVSTPDREGRPGQTVKFVFRKGGRMLFSLQFYTLDGPFLYFKWTKKTAREFGFDEALQKHLFKDIRPIIKGRGDRENVPTEWRLYLKPIDQIQFREITKILTPLVKNAKEAFLTH